MHWRELVPGLGPAEFQALCGQVGSYVCVHEPEAMGMQTVPNDRLLLDDCPVPNPEKILDQRILFSAVEDMTLVAAISDTGNHLQVTPAEAVQQ